MENAIATASPIHNPCKNVKESSHNIIAMIILSVNCENMHLDYKSSFFVLVTQNKVENAIVIASPDRNLCKNVKHSSPDIIAMI